MTDTADQDADSGRLLRSSAVVSGMTSVSRVLGLVRDMVIAVFLGAATNADAFFIAFRIPNFFRRLFAEGAFAQAFVPVLAEYQTGEGAAGMRHLVDRVAGALGGTLLSFTLLAVVAAPLVAMVFAPGFYLHDPAKFALTASLIRITFPYLFLISLTGFAGAILNSLGRFAVPAFTPVLLNLSLISAALLFAPHVAEPAYALAWGVFFAGMLQLLFQVPSLVRVNVLPRPKWDWHDPGVRKVLKLMAPAMFGVSVSQVNLLFDTVIASFLPTGSVSWLYFSDRLVEFPLGVFGIAIATVILPSLSRTHARADSEAFAVTLDWAIRSILLIALPAMVGLLVLAEPILTTLFMYGKMSPSDVAMSALSLRAYALGLTAFMLIKVLAPGYFSRQDTRTPVRIGIWAMVSNMVMNVAFVVPFYHFLHAGHAGLALATSLAAWLNAGLLWRGLAVRGVYRRQPGFVLAVLRIVLAAVAMGVTLALLAGPAVRWTQFVWWQRGEHIGVLIAIGIAVYFGVLLLLGARPARWRQQR